MSIPQRVTKTHATGNDFIIYLDPEGCFDPSAEEVRHLCDRHRGVGGDGVIRLTHPEHVSDLSGAQVEACCDGGAEWFMDYRNSDGSLAEMCGNGTRATALFARRAGCFAGECFPLGTRAGVKTLTFLGDVEPYGRDVFRVDIGAWSMGECEAYEVTLPGVAGSARGTFVDMGNPHVVAVLDDAATLPDVDELDLNVKPCVAPTIPSDQNVEFVRVDCVGDAAGDEAVGRATMRVHERGCGETLSCGTGLCATAVTLRSRTGVAHWDITVRGGVLRLDVTDDNVALTGPATLVADLDLL